MNTCLEESNICNHKYNYTYEKSKNFFEVPIPKPSGAFKTKFLCLNAKINEGLIFCIRKF